MVSNFYDNFFIHHNGKKTPYFKMKKPNTNKIIIQHPLIHFDPQNSKIYNERYIINPSNKKLNRVLLNFIKKSEEYYELEEDEQYWYETGYWTLVDEKYMYFGFGENSLEKTLSFLKKGKFNYCLSFRDTILFIKGKFKNEKIFGKIEIDIYINNCFLPIVETIEPIRKTIYEMGNYYLTSDNFVKYEDIFLGEYIKEFGISYSYLLRNEKNILIPYAVVSKGYILGYAVVINDFSEFPINELNDLKFIFGGFAGGNLPRDFFKAGKYNYICRIGIFSNIILLDGNFSYDLDNFDGLDKKNKKAKSKRKIIINKNYLEKFW